MLEAEINAGEVQKFFAIGILSDEGDVPFGGFDVFDKKLRRLIDHRLVRYPHASRQFSSELVSNTLHFPRGLLYHIGWTTKIEGRAKFAGGSKRLHLILCGRRLPERG